MDAQPRSSPEAASAPTRPDGDICHAAAGAQPEGDISGYPWAGPYRTAVYSGLSLIRQQHCSFWRTLRHGSRWSWPAPGLRRACFARRDAGAQARLLRSKLELPGRGFTEHGRTMRCLFPRRRRFGVRWTKCIHDRHKELDRCAAPHCLLALAATFSLGACAAPPPAGPSVMALPGQGKNFDAFQQDDALCRQFAFQQAGGASPSAAATQSGVGSAVVGTALGAGRAPPSGHSVLRPARAQSLAALPAFWRAARSAPTTPPPHTAVSSNSTTSATPSACTHTAIPFSRHPLDLPPTPTRTPTFHMLTPAFTGRHSLLHRSPSASAEGGAGAAAGGTAAGGTAAAAGITDADQPASACPACWLRPSYRGPSACRHPPSAPSPSWSPGRPSRSSA